MALAFKRALADAEKAVQTTNNTIKDKYKTTVSPAFVVDFEGIKAIEGVSNRNPNSVEGPKNVTLVNWVKEYANRFHAVWGDVQYKDKQFALPFLLQHLDKVVLHVDDKGPAGKYTTYDTEWKGKDFHIYVHIDFTSYPQQPNLSHETNGNVHQAVWDHLDQLSNLTYELRKTHSVNDSGSHLNTQMKNLKQKLKKDFPIVVDWDSVFKLEGSSLEYANRPDVPNRARGVTFLEDGRGFHAIYYAIETVVKDKLGMEAFLETFDKILVAVEPGSTEVRSGPNTVAKDGKTLKITFKLNLNNLKDARADYADLAKKIETLL